MPGARTRWLIALQANVLFGRYFSNDCTFLVAKGCTMLRA